MTALPSASAFTGSAVTEGEFKTELTNLISYLSGLLDTPGTAVAALTKLGVIGNSVLSKTAAYTVVAADRGTLIDCTGTWSLSLTAAATLGNFAFAVRNSGGGAITIDPNLSETIDGSTTLALAAGASAICVCNGTNWYTVGYIQGSTVNVQSFTSSGTWTKPSSGTLAVVRIWGGGGGGARDGTGGNGTGGGGGGYAERIFTLSALSGTVAVTIGAGGAGAATNGVGTAGGDSTFGSYLTGKGGGGGKTDGTDPTQAGFAVSGGTAVAVVPFAGGIPSSKNAVGGGGAGGFNLNAGDAGGVSMYGGDGGTGGDGTPSPASGSVPGGGGGGGQGVAAGSGAAGQCIVIVV